MSRPPLFLPLLIAAGSSLAQPAHAQQSATPGVDAAAVLATLKDLRAKQTTVVTHEKTNVLAAINGAIANPGKAYQQAVAAVEPQGGNNNNEASRNPEWRRRQGDLLLNRDFINGLRLQLVYLALTFQHQMGAKTADLLNPLLDYVAQAAQAADAVYNFEPLRRGIGESVFAAYFQVAPFLAGMSGWEDRPFNVEGIYEKTILPEMRLEKDPRLLAYWDSHIQGEGAAAAGSQNALQINKFNTIRLPSLLWGRAEDEIALGRQSQGIADMLTQIKAHPDHPDFQKWASELEQLVSPPAPAPSPSATPAALASPPALATP
jgi:hypothetical protein